MNQRCIQYRIMAMPHRIPGGTRRGDKWHDRNESGKYRIDGGEWRVRIGNFILTILAGGIAILATGMAILAVVHPLQTGGVTIRADMRAM